MTPPDVLRCQIMLTVYGARPELGTDGAGEVADALLATHDVTPREAQDGSGGAEVGSAVHGEGSGAPAGSQGVTDVPLLVRVRVNRPGEPERWVVGAISKNDPAIAAALAEARSKARATCCGGRPCALAVRVREYTADDSDLLVDEDE